MTPADRDPGSWRDPWGFVYRREGTLYRQIAPAGAAAWTAFSTSELAKELVASGRLLPWEAAGPEQAADSSAAKVIRPEAIDLISYPYEWSFGQLKAAALLTLDVQLDAIAAGFSLRDASAYNVQFRGVQPLLIDHLSFEPLPDRRPWVAYRQFCEHFLGPLALMAHVDPRLGGLLRDHLDGIPLDLAARLMPGSTRLRPGLGAHLHLHSRAIRRDGGAGSAAREAHLSLGRLRTLVEGLRQTVDGLRWDPEGTTWADYAESPHESYRSGTAGKAALVAQLLGEGQRRWAWDLGANTGDFSQVAADAGYRVVALEGDVAAADKHYRRLVNERRTATLPLLMDLANPSPAQGWAGTERRSLVERTNADVLLALALVHHLAIGGNVPLPMVMEFFASLAPRAVVEFVPREDPMVVRMLASREDVFGGYTEAGFRAAAERFFTVDARLPIDGSRRVLYGLSRR